MNDTIESVNDTVPDDVINENTIPEAVIGGTDSGADNSVAYTLDDEDADQEPSVTPPVENLTVSDEVLTFENAKYFKNKDGRIFSASETLRRLGKEQGLVPCSAPQKGE